MKFPRRRFIVNEAITFNKANVSTRNFPESVAQLRKKWKLKEGGNIYLFFVRDINDEKMMLICSKVQCKYSFQIFKKG